MLTSITTHPMFTSAAAPSITSFTYLTNVANYFYSIELTFSEPVTYSSDTVSVTVHDTSNTISNPNYYPTLSTTGISPVGSVSNFITFTFGTNLYQSFTSLTIGAGLAKSPDNIGSEIFSSTMATLTLSAGVAPMLTAFNYDVSLGMITLKFSTYVRFASFNPAGISLTNKNGTTIPVIPVSSVPDPLHPYNNVLLTLPVQDTVWLATSPWIGANVSLLYLNLPQAAITDYYGLAVAAETAMPVTNLSKCPSPTSCPAPHVMPLPPQPALVITRARTSTLSMETVSHVTQAVPPAVGPSPPPTMQPSSLDAVVARWSS